MASKIIIVGGVAAGATAAAKARRVNEQAEITVYERGPYISFANCGLPYYVGGTIPERSGLLLQTPEGFWKRYRVQVRVRHEVTKVDRALRQVHVRNLETGETFKDPYDKLILCPGAGAIIPPLPGLILSSPQEPLRLPENVFTVKTVPDSDAIKDFLEKQKPGKAVVIGAGFIGLETAEALKKRGLQVTIVEMLPQVLPPLDADVASFMARHITEQGVDVVLADAVKAFHGKPRVNEIELASGRRVPAELVILSIGVRPELELARDAGLSIGASGGIDVDDRQATSDPLIYAAGDAVEVVHRVTKKKTRIAMAGPANKQGRVAGANAAGGDLKFPGALGTAIVECLGMTAAKTGLSEREARQAGLDGVATWTHAGHHAGYYPGSEMLHIKLISERVTGRILGGQIVGAQGVDKRADVLATALAAGMKVTDLENLDLAYAPPFSSAKDPVIMSGFVAANVQRGDTATLTPEELFARQKRDPACVLVDVRTRKEFESGTLAGAVNVPVDELRERINELDPGRETIVYCRVGYRGYLAERILRQNGFKKVFNLTGGMLSVPASALASAPAPVAASLPSGPVSVEVLKPLVDQGNAASVVDVREAGEYSYEHIPGTTNLPLTRWPAAAARLPKNQEIYILCQSGVRTQQAAQMLVGAGYTRVHCVDGGISAWTKAGFPTQKSGGVIPIMRQVQIVAGSLVVVGVLLPGWGWTLSAFVGAGLVFAGVSGTCGMAGILAKMPWNRNSGGSCDASGPQPPSCSA